jgi:hypothetical protein
MDILSAILVTIFITSMVVGAIIGGLAHSSGVQETQKKAVKAGVAEYIPGKNGESVFVWKKGVPYQSPYGTGSTGPM